MWCLTVNAVILLIGIVVADDVNSTTEHHDVTAPIEFPKPASDYNLIQNKTILDNLTRHESIDTEVDDLMHGGTQQLQLDDLAGDVFTKDNFKDVIAEEGAKEETELIQTHNNEDRWYKAESAKNAQGQRPPPVQGQLAAILAGIFVLVAAVGYAGLLAWRRFLENRYGDREMLVTDPNDLSHFSVS